MALAAATLQQAVSQLDRRIVVRLASTLAVVNSRAHLHSDNLVLAVPSLVIDMAEQVEQQLQWSAHDDDVHKNYQCLLSLQLSFFAFFSSL